ncbi:MAG: isoleucine--tRNA ligase [Chloroflexi bacterium]|nr:isoleucine--tRNA ligase [Chloroflexota bacterium]
MVFQEVSTKLNFPELEEKVLRFWQEHHTFRKSMDVRAGAQPFVFYEGPPTANGLPGIHHVLGRVYKDTIPRYQTMKGRYVLRKGGWDTHGLPVEIEVEKELGFSGKQAIEEYGVAEFNERCRASVFRYTKEWTKLSDRIGFWLDMENPYVTLSTDYIESVWWILKQLWDRDLLYQGYKVVPYCPRCGTPLSSHELALGYETTVDPSIYVKFPLRDEANTYFLVWTTTPWTLPGNVALAVHPDETYVMVEQGGERLILVKALLNEALRGEYTILKEMPGRDLKGIHYRPLYTFLPVEGDYCYVLLGDFVTTAEGTGIVHIAPAFGEDDLNVGREYNLPILQTVDLKGNFIDAVTPWRGLFVKDADPLIMEDLRGRGLMYHVGQYEHVYPFCWRCDTPLLYYAKTTWYIETTRYKDRLLANNQLINWIPSHIKDGRFGDWLQNNVDWALGRERYWGTPLPVWVCDGCGEKTCIGSVAELRERVRDPKAHVGALTALRSEEASLSELDLHRPYIDQVTFPCSKCAGTMRRVPEVIDCWFDSGAMPVAQWHYPFENKELFQSQFPADFICEGIDQTRGWFYSLHAIATLLFDQPAYKTCISFGLVLDEEGQKMSKSKGNVVDPWEVINVHGADATRWYFYTAAPPDYPRRFSVDLVGETVRKFMLTLWNTYGFFVTYANIDGFDPRQGWVDVKQRPEIDRWILSELNALVRVVDEGMSNFDMTGPARAIQDFVDDLSNWYVRRSRRRFWKSGLAEDKRSAHHTLYTCLVTLCKLLAPFTPFTAEAMYQNLVRAVDASAPESVHLCDYPQADAALIDPKLMADTRLVMRLASLGHAARNKAGLKVRQPLAEVAVVLRSAEEQASVQRLQELLLDELNVKSLRLVEDKGELVTYTARAVASLVGKKYGSLFPKVQGALAKMNAEEVARSVSEGRSVEVEVEGQWITLNPGEVEVRTHEREGYVVAEDAGYLVAIRTALTPQLISEGLARELVRRVQTLRKEADFRIDETISTYYQTGPQLGAVLHEWAEYFKGETLSVLLEETVEAPDERAYTGTFDVDGEAITFWLLPSADSDWWTRHGK